MKKQEFLSNQPLRVWSFVIGLNLIAFVGLIYLRTKGIDLYHFRGGT